MRQQDPRRRPQAGHGPAGDHGARPDRSGGPSRSSRPVGRSTLWADEEHRSAPQPLRAAWRPVPDSTPQSSSSAARLRPRRPEHPGHHDDTRAPRSRARRRSALGWFVHRYGWRAYALPVLVALTVVVIVQVARTPVSDVAAPVGSAPGTVQQTAPAAPAGDPPTVVVTQTQTRTATASATASAELPPAPTPAANSVTTAPDPNGAWAKNIKDGALPAGASFVAKGKGTWHVVKGTSGVIGTGPQKYTFTIEVEDGLQSSQADQEFAQSVVSTLSDPRSWIGGKEISLQRVDSGEPSFRISLTSQMTIRDPAYCAYSIQLEASCYNRSAGRVFINDARWVRGAVSFNGDLGSYRVYAINHEVGHALGYGHQPCAKQGGLAPVMMQQSFSTSNADLHVLDPQNIPDNDLVCVFNPYPYPRVGAG